MTIVYACICRQKDAAILTEVCDKDVKGTVGNVMVELMQHLRDHPEMFQEGDLKTFVQRNEKENDFFSHFFEACSAVLGDDVGEATVEHYFHLFFSDGVFYGCLGDDPDTRDQKVNFAFLHHIHKEFVKMYRAGRIRTANAYSLDKGFAPTIRTAMHYHNIHHKEIRQEEGVTRLMAKVESMRDVMGRNIHMILQRGEKFDRLLAKSDALRADASVFKKKARTAKHEMQRRYYCWTVVLMVVFIGFLYMMMAGMCGLDFSFCRRKSDDASSAEGGGGEGEEEGDEGGDGGDQNRW